MPDEAGQRLDRQRTKSLPLRSRPGLEGLLPEAEAIEQVSAIDVGRPGERFGRPLGGESLECRDVDIDAGGVECHAVSLDRETGRALGPKSPLQDRQGLPEVGARLILRAVRPQEIGKPLARLKPARRRGEECEQRPRLARKRDRFRSLCSGNVEAAKQSHAQTGHARPPNSRELPRRRHFRMVRTAFPPAVSLEDGFFTIPLRAH